MLNKKVLVTGFALMVMALGVTACDGAPQTTVVTQEVEVETVVTEEVVKEVVVTATPPPKSSDAVVVKIAGGNFGEAAKDVYFEPFTSESGIRVLYEMGYADPALLKAMQEVGAVEWDVALQGAQDAVPAYNNGWLDPIDYSRIDPEVLAGFPEKSLFEWGIAHHGAGLVLSYNTDEFTADNHPSTWADFWDVERFPGARSLPAADYNARSLIIALLADGVPPDKLFPIDFDRAFAKLEEIEPYVTKWFAAGQECADLLTAKEVVLAACWNARVQTPIDDGAPLAIEWNEGVFGGANWVLPSNAPNSDEARYAFLNFVLRAEVQAEIAKRMPYVFYNADQLEFLDPDDLVKMPSSYIDLLVIDDQAWWAEPHEGTDGNHQQFVFEVWPEWLASR